jgi:hypothetical protein
MEKNNITTITETGDMATYERLVKKMPVVAASYGGLFKITK